MNLEERNLGCNEVADLRHQVDHTVSAPRQPHKPVQVECEHNTVLRVVNRLRSLLTENLVNIRWCSRRRDEWFRIDALNDLASYAAHYLQDPARPQDFADVV